MCGGVLPLCREAVGVFYSPIRLGKRYPEFRYMKKKIANFEKLSEVGIQGCRVGDVSVYRSLQILSLMLLYTV